MQVKWLEMFACGTIDSELETRTPVAARVSLKGILSTGFGSFARSQFHSFGATEATACARIASHLSLGTLGTQRLCLVTMVTRRLPIHRTACCCLSRSLFNFDGSSRSHAHSCPPTQRSPIRHSIRLREIDANTFYLSKLTLAAKTAEPMPATNTE